MGLAPSAWRSSIESGDFGVGVSTEVSLTASECEEIRFWSGVVSRSELAGAPRSLSRGAGEFRRAERFAFEKPGWREIHPEWTGRKAPRNCLHWSAMARTDVFFGPPCCGPTLADAPSRRREARAVHAAWRGTHSFGRRESEPRRSGLRPHGLTGPSAPDGSARARAGERRVCLILVPLVRC
jgi:hypothetical protein